MAGLLVASTTSIWSHLGVCLTLKWTPKPVRFWEPFKEFKITFLELKQAEVHSWPFGPKLWGTAFQGHPHNVPPPSMACWLQGGALNTKAGVTGVWGRGCSRHAGLSSVNPGGRGIITPVVARRPPRAWTL